VSQLTVGAVLADEVSVEALLDDDLGVVHPHQLRTDRATHRATTTTTTTTTTSQ